MTDATFGDYGQMLRLTELRVEDVRTRIVGGAAPFTLRIPRTNRGTMVYLLKGDFRLEIDGSKKDSRTFAEGTALGFEDGRAHRWFSTSARGAPVSLLVSSLPLRMSVLRRLDERYMAIPPDADPFATTIRLAVQLHVHEHRAAAAEDDAVIRRCAEICLLQFVGYAQRSVMSLGKVPRALAHDEYMLRAWGAYFREPRRRWTVAALAAAAGMGRTSFAVRFRKVFGAPPLRTLTDMRLERATSMLRDSGAPLIEIAFMSGYNSEAAFVRAFQRRYRVPPGQYRARSGGSMRAAQPSHAETVRHS